MGGILTDKWELIWHKHDRLVAVAKDDNVENMG